MWRKDHHNENVKALKDVLNHTMEKCPSCGQALSTSEFTLDENEKE